MPYGTGRNKKDTINSHKMRSIITIRGNDIFCFPEAPVTAMARVDHVSNRENIIKYKNYRRILHKKSLSIEFSHKFAHVEVTRNGCGISEFKVFQKYLFLEKYIMKIYAVNRLGALNIIYNRKNVLFENVDIAEYKKIYILK